MFLLIHRMPLFGCRAAVSTIPTHHSLVLSVLIGPIAQFLVPIITAFFALLVSLPPARYSHGRLTLFAPSLDVYRTVLADQPSMVSMWYDIELVGAVVLCADDRVNVHWRR